MRFFLAFLTYFSYIFIVLLYGLKLIEYLKLPTHLRWELYPVVPEKRCKYGGSYMEELSFFEKDKKSNPLRGLLYLLKEYFILSEYWKQKKSYWLYLYPWHIGFISIILFHIMCFLSAVVMNYGISVERTSEHFVGVIFFYSTIVLSLTSFLTGLFGSVGLFFKRLTDSDLRLYASPMNFFNYLFTFFVFLSGLIALTYDPNLSQYRSFWLGVITSRFVEVDTPTTIHIILFCLFLIYLPFTRSIHYITRIFGFFLIRWDDKPNRRGSLLEKELEGLLSQRVSWAAPHIFQGKSWRENAVEMK